VTLPETPNKSFTRLIAIDPGSAHTGIIVLDAGNISEALVLGKEECVKHVLSHSDHRHDTLVLIEDVMPYGYKVSLNVLDTCKFIGELCYRLKVAGWQMQMISRWHVSKWIFESFAVARDRVEKKIVHRDKRKKDGTLWTPHFSFVDDRIVVAAMKEMWDVPTPAPGKPSKYGLSKDSWQALALASYYITIRSLPSGTAPTESILDNCELPVQ
jgi:hypothetical protein